MSATPEQIAERLEVVGRALDEAREEGFQEGYLEGQGDANCAATDTFNAMLLWLRGREMLKAADYPEGFTAEDIIEALNEHEENLISHTKRDTLRAQSERERVLVEALAQIEGGHVPGMANLVLAHDWHAVVNLFQSIARAALKAAP